MSSLCNSNGTQSRGGEEDCPVYVDYQRLFSSLALRLQQQQQQAGAQTEWKAASADCIRMNLGLPSPEVFPIIEADFKLNDGSVFHVGKELLQQHLQYGPSNGHHGLREWLMEFQRRVHSPPTLQPDHPGLFDLAITPGGGESISAIFRLLLDKGDWVLMEEATFFSALRMLYPMECHAQGIRVDEFGMVTEDMERVLTTWSDLHPGSPKPKLLYVIPNCNNPTGRMMTLARKRALYRIARAHGLLIVEDGAYYLMQFPQVPGQPPTSTPTLLSMDVDGRVIHVDTFSKTIAPGLRVGVVSGPQAVLQMMAVMNATNFRNASGVSQVLLFQLLRHWGHEGFLRHARCVTEYYQKKIEVALGCAEKHLTGLAEWNAPTGGMFFWLRVLGVSSSQAVTDLLEQDEVLMLPGWVCSVSSERSPHIRVNIAMSTAENCEKAFSSLAKAIQKAQTMEMNQ